MQPYRLWRDTPLWRRVGLLVGVAGGVCCIAAGIVLPALTGEAWWPRSWLTRPPGEILGIFLTIVGSCLVLATPGWFLATALILRDVATGYSTGVIKFGKDDQGKECAVAHIRRGRHKFACYCKLLHSDAEAKAAGWRYSGAPHPCEGIGWGGLAHLLREADRPTDLP